MKKSEFTLIIPEIENDTIDAVYRRCSDSSIGKSNGIMYAAFDREATSLESAINSAIVDLRQVGIEPIRVEMDIQKSVLAS